MLGVGVTEMRTAQSSAFVPGASLNAQATARMARFGGASIRKQAGLPIRPPHHIHELVDLAPLVGLISRSNRVFDAMRDMIAKDFLLDPS